MNREIEFRAKKLETHDWIYGNYSYIQIYDPKEYIVNSYEEYFKVIPETIGQYTGLKDKNGKKIFEGDILKNDEFTLAVVYNPRVQSFVLIDGNEWLNESSDRICDCDDIEEKFINNIFEYNCVSYEVIGNIYENKELLGGSDNE